MRKAVGGGGRGDVAQTVSKAQRTNTNVNLYKLIRKLPLKFF